MAHTANFYPRSPCGERRVTVLGIQHKVGISIHALLAESDTVQIVVVIVHALFLSTLSLRRATTPEEAKRWNSTISIHALLAESDELHVFLGDDGFNFYPRSPCGERRGRCQPHFAQDVFLSTLSLRRATPHKSPPCRLCCISIHALLAESDHIHCLTLLYGYRFLSTLSLRRATVARCMGFAVDCISIHALLAESDKARLSCLAFAVYFYPRSPCGERHQEWSGSQQPGDFYPRSPCGERLYGTVQHT